MEQRGSVNLALTVGMIGRGKDSQQRQDGVEYVVKKLCQHIRGVVTGDEWRKYEASKLDPSRIELFLDRKEIKSCVQKYLKLHPSHKDKTKAMILKNAANKAFGSGDNSGALHLYTQCLALMPHGTKDVAVVYANRSAALFHLQEYWLSKRDAELAFHLNYPTELHYKLFERLGRLAHGVEASRHFQAAIKALESSGLDELKMKKTKKVLEELRKNPAAIPHGFHQNQGGGSAGAQQPISLPTLPDIAGGRSKYLRTASSRLTLQYREKQGRFVVANEAFRPGDVILVEPAFVSVLNPDQYHKQCFECNAPLLAPIVCETCIFASFCSSECQKKAQQHHQYECSILGILKNSGISVICYMAVRILTKNNPKTVLEWYGLAEKTELEEMSQSLENKVPMDQSNNCLDKTRTLETLGFNEEYRTDHVALFHLVTHSQRREPEEYFHQIVMALYLLEVLKTTSYFDQFKSCASGKSDTKQENGIGGTSLPSRDQRCEESLRENGKKSPDELTPTSISQNEPACLEDIPREVEIKFAVLLLRCLKSLQFNTHETAAWDEESDKDNSVGLGGALYPTLALFNHSCNPAIVRYFVNDTVVVRAIRTIVPGEVVTENYGPNYSNVPLEERQMRLNDVYWFKCECIACLQNWPAFSEMTNDMMKFRCEFCRTFICKSDENMGILFNCGKCGKSVNVLKAMKAIHETDAKYSQAVQFINSGNFETGLGMIQENLFTLEKFLMPPFREFHMCQEHMRRCYLTLGNRVSKLPAWDPETVKMDD